MLILLYTGGGSVEHGLDVVYHTSMRGGTPCFMFLLTRDVSEIFITRNS